MNLCGMREKKSLLKSLNYNLKFVKIIYSVKKVLKNRKNILKCKFLVFFTNIHFIAKQSRKIENLKILSSRLIEKIRGIT